MAGDGKVAAAAESVMSELSRLDGEVDAGIVFAAAAGEAYRNGETEFAEACLSDARDIYSKVISALGKANLTAAQLQDLLAKVVRLRQALTDLRSLVRNEAA
jgi:hypothetical protein